MSTVTKDQQVDDDNAPMWHTQEENILKSWSEIGSSYRYLHNASYSSYKSLYAWFSLPVIILSTVAGTANFATASFPVSWRENVTLCVGALNLAAGLITTIAQFFSISENLEGHRVASVEFGKLSRNIAIELSLPVAQRSKSGSEFIKEYRTRLDSLMEKSPSVPYKIVRKFGSRFNESEFAMPDILEILPVEIYRNADEELEKEKKKLDAMRAAAADEVRLHIETRADEVARKRHEMKKRRVSAMGISHTMSKLISSMDSAVRLPSLANESLERHSDQSDDDDGSDLTVNTLDLMVDDDLNVVESTAKETIEKANSLVTDVGRALTDLTIKEVPTISEAIAQQQPQPSASPATSTKAGRSKKKR